MMTAAVESESQVVKRGRRNWGEPAMRIAATGSAIVILLMLAALVVVLFVAAVPSIKHFGPGFLMTSTWRPNPLPVLKLDAHGRSIRDRRTGMKVVDHNEPPRFGALASLCGTAQTSMIALLLAVPLSLGAAFYLVRIAPHWLIMPVSFLIEFLAAIPSIAYGLWGMFVLGPWMGGPSRWERIFGILPVPAGIESRFAWLFLQIPGLHWLAQQRIGTRVVPIPTTGRDVLVAGIILGIMIIPIITAISRDVLRNVPRAQIEGTIALGATWWQSCRETLKYSRSALFGAIILGMARAAGETMAVLMVMGSAAVVATSPFMAGTTMASQLAGEFPEASTNDLHRGALMELALILLVMSLAFNVVARYLVVGKSARTSAAH
ncbi:MAG TPA: PstC family ABC transporter permease [Tepidisphaeraceae bacterium]|jgi:phosphate transport system permease protein|nr:PstC family ABC transporter permease [Tepidisphaeraceae bacterium]